MHLMSPNEAAVKLDISAAGVRCAIRRGKLPARRVLGRWKLRPEDVDAAAAGWSPISEAAHEPAAPAARPVP